MGSLKKLGQFGPAVWPAIGNIYIHECLVLLYKIDNCISYFNATIILNVCRPIQLDCQEVLQTASQVYPKHLCLIYNSWTIYSIYSLFKSGFSINRLVSISTTKTIQEDLFKEHFKNVTSESGLAFVKKSANQWLYFIWLLIQW